jgi:hypothetical protein
LILNNFTDIHSVRAIVANSNLPESRHGGWPTILRVAGLAKVGIARIHYRPEGSLSTFSSIYEIICRHDDPVSDFMEPRRGCALLIRND